jgi:hypothetical protein
MFLAVLHFWSVRHVINPDGVSYVDVARAMARGDWATARNSTWSPLFPALTALMLKLRVAGTALGHEWVAAHLATLLLFAVALYAFTRFWRLAGERSGGIGSAHPVAWPLLGYLLFATTFIPTLDVLTPDLGVAAVVLGASAFLITFARGEASVRSAALFGIVLGAGYIDKAVLFPIGLVALALFGAVQVFQKRSLLPPVVAGIAFVLLAAPLVIVQSRAEHKLTFGEAGRLAYAYNVNDYNFDANTKIAIGPKVLESPALYQVPLRSGITFSPWYDPAVLGKDIKSKMHPREQALVLYGNYKILRDLFLGTFGVLAMAWLVLLSCGSRQEALIHWPALLLAFAGLALYSAVLIETRYIGAFVLVVLGGLLGGVNVGAGNDSVRASRPVLVSATLILGFLAAPSLFSYLDARVKDNTQLDVAASLARQYSLPEDATVGVIGDPRWQFWPQALHWRIAAVIPRKQASTFWSLSPAEREQTLHGFRASGAQLVIAESDPTATPAGCKPLATLPYCVVTSSIELER